MTTDEIASRTGVSKATIYKWWPNKSWLPLGTHDHSAGVGIDDDVRDRVRRQHSRQSLGAGGHHQHRPTRTPRASTPRRGLPGTWPKQAISVRTLTG
jgi:hypothetical protein